MGNVAESDWKIFKEVRPKALDRLCERALRAVVAVSEDSTRSWHDRYLAVYESIHQYDDQIAESFNGFSRSRMMMQLMRMHSLDLIDESEWGLFSQELRDRIAKWSSL